MIYLQLFLSFFKVGLFSIGGGYAAVPLIQSQAVEKYSWLSLSEFTDLISIAEMTPGPITVNSATFIGIRMAGIAGALISTLGCILPSIIIVSAMFFLYRKVGKMEASQTVLSYIRPAVVALIAYAGISILKSVINIDTSARIPFDIVAVILFVVAFIVIRKFKLNPIIIMLSCGVLYFSVSLCTGNI